MPIAIRIVLFSTGLLLPMARGGTRQAPFHPYTVCSLRGPIDALPGEAGLAAAVPLEAEVG